MSPFFAFYDDPRASGPELSCFVGFAGWLSGSDILKCHETCFSLAGLRLELRLSLFFATAGVQCWLLILLNCFRCPFAFASGKFLDSIANISVFNHLRLKMLFPPSFADQVHSLTEKNERRKLAFNSNVQWCSFSCVSKTKSGWLWSWKNFLW